MGQSLESWLWTSQYRERRVDHRPNLRRNTNRLVALGDLAEQRFAARYFSPPRTRLHSDPAGITSFGLRSFSRRDGWWRGKTYIGSMDRIAPRRGDFGGLRRCGLWHRASRLSSYLGARAEFSIQNRRKAWLVIDRKPCVRFVVWLVLLVLYASASSFAGRTVWLLKKRFKRFNPFKTFKSFRPRFMRRRRYD
jgi:hypothetical protein